MKVILFGATGMIGQSVLRECLLDAEIDVVETIGRSPTRVANARLREIARADLFHYANIEDQMRVKGKTENPILRLPFRAACAFRPAAIVAMNGAMNGEQSRTTAHRVMYTVLRPLVPMLRNRLWKAPVSALWPESD